MTTAAKPGRYKDYMIVNNHLLVHLAVLVNVKTELYSIVKREKWAIMKDEVIKVANIIIESIVYLFSRGAFVKKFAPPPEDFYSKSHHIRRFSQGTLYQAILKKRLILSSPLSLLHVSVWPINAILNRRSYQR